MWSCQPCQIACPLVAEIESRHANREHRPDIHCDTSKTASDKSDTDIETLVQSGDRGFEATRSYVGSWEYGQQGSYLAYI